jgi:hypothetical protein
MMWIASVDRVLVTLRGDEADARAFFLDDGVGADGRAVREERDVAAELAQLEAQGPGAGAERIHHPARKILRRRWHLGGEKRAGAIDDRAIREGAADVDAYEIAH